MTQKEILNGLEESAQLSIKPGISSFYQVHGLGHFLLIGLSLAVLSFQLELYTHLRHATWPLRAVNTLIPTKACNQIATTLRRRDCRECDVLF